MSDQHSDFHQSANSSRLWLADSIRSLILSRVMESAADSRQLGIRPRLVIFDYLESPVAGPLRAMASELGMIVGVEPVERTLPGAALRDRFRLLEKSQGVHGVVFPCAMSSQHRASLEYHPELKALDVDASREAFSPVLMSFLQLAAAYGWNPEGRRVSLLISESTAHHGESIRAEMSRVGMNVSLVRLERGEDARHLSQTDCLWLCHGLPVHLHRLHLSASSVVVDCGRAFDLPASLTATQNRYLAGRVRGLCPADGGLTTLTYLHRIHRLLKRALGSARPGMGARSRQRSASSAKGVRG